jgi:hypothetical protein
MRAEFFFENNWLLSQNHHQKREQIIMMSSTQLASGCSLGTQRDTTNEHRTRTKSRDEKEILNFYAEKASSQPKVPMLISDKNI